MHPHLELTNNANTKELEARLGDKSRLVHKPRRVWESIGEGSKIIQYVPNSQLFTDTKIILPFVHELIERDGATWTEYMASQLAGAYPVTGMTFLNYLRIALKSNGDQYDVHAMKFLHAIPLVLGNELSIKRSYAFNKQLIYTSQESLDQFVKENTSFETIIVPNED